MDWRVEMKSEDADVGRYQTKEAGLWGTSNVSEPLPTPSLSQLSRSTSSEV